MTGLQVFTLAHVAISVFGIIAGLIVLSGFVRGIVAPLWTRSFLAFTILTSVTGFFFPFRGITPGIVIGVLSLIDLALAVSAYRLSLTRTFVVSATVAEFLNVLVLIVQLFGKVPVLHQYAPKGNEPIVAVVQLLALLVFAALAVKAIRSAKYFLL